jgi:F-type H+-transporting ATPase subunit b
MAEHIAVQEVPGEAGHEEATAFGMGPGFYIALAMFVVILLLFWGKAHRMVASALDKKIEAISGQLAEAEDLRKQAESLKAEYAAKAAAAEKEAAAVIERAHHEAEAMLAKASTDADSLVERRARMAEDKIAAEERAAIQQLRAAAADAATAAAARIISNRVDGKVDSALIDKAITGLGGR